MGEYKHSAKVKAAPDALFNYLADVRNLPKYMNKMTSAESAGKDQVNVTANVHGKEVAGTAEFHVDKTKRQIRWSSEGPSNYHGDLHVTGSGDASEVTVSIHTARAEGQEIEEGVKRTVANIVRLVEGQSSKAA